MLRAVAPAIVVVSMLSASDSALAESIAISCEKETITVPEWKNPLSISYEGAENGTLAIKAEHTEFSLPASFRMHAEDGTRMIEAFAETTAVMPDLAALDGCTAAKIPADLKGDADFYNVTSMSCLGVTAASAAPVRITASVRIGILPPADVIVEMKRTYLDASAGPGGVMYVETYPANCKVDSDPK